MVPSNIRKPDYADDMAGVSYSEQRDRATNNAIRVYTEEELDGETGLRHACRMGREVLDIAGKALRPGVTTDEIDRIVHEACIERDCYPSPLNYYNFPKSVCTSINEGACVLLVAAAAAASAIVPTCIQNSPLLLASCPSS